MTLHALLDYVPLLGLLLLAAVIDLRQRRIPNWLTFGLIAAGFARALVITGPSGIPPALSGLAAAAAVPFILFVMGALGGGDVKLLAGIGTWLGATQALAVFAGTCVIGLVLILFQAVSQRRVAALFRNSAVLAAGIAQKGVAGCADESFSSIDRPLPYAVPVSLATLLILLARSWNGI
jgi:prepilin peptidase CpaA